VRPRKGKAQEQVGRQRDRLREDQRHGSLKEHRQGQSRVRARFVSTSHYDSEEDFEYGNQELTNAGRVIIQYEQPGKARDRDCLSYDVRHVLERQSRSSHHENTVIKRPAEGYAHHYQKGNRSVSRQRNVVQRDQPVTVPSKFVSFYFTNVPHNISYVDLRRGFEVCGVMEDVYLARKCNVNGGAFGFVRYGNVKDVDKLLKAVNNVWFGD